MSELTPNGFRLREILAEQGCELTPDQLTDSLDEAFERIRPGPDGCCVKCGHDGSDGRDFRFGLCDVCAFPDRVREEGPNDE